MLVFEYDDCGTAAGLLVESDGPKREQFSVMNLVGFEPATFSMTFWQRHATDCRRSLR
jgi:hypothetical protein